MTPLKRDGQPPNYNPRHLTLTKLSYESSYSIKHEKQVRSLSSKAIGSNSRETIATQPATVNLSMCFARSNAHLMVNGVMEFYSLVL